MIRFLILLLLCSVASAQVPVATKSAGHPADNNIGMNVVGTEDFEQAWIFADLLRTNNRRTSSPDNITGTNPDETSPPQTFVSATESSVLRLWPQTTSDVWTVRVRDKTTYAPGTGTIRIQLPTGVGTTANTDFTADGTIGPFSQAVIDAMPEGLNFWITANDGNTFFEIWAPGSNLPTTIAEVESPFFKFYPPAISKLKQFGILRNLDFMRINRNAGRAGLRRPVVTVADQIPYDRRGQGDKTYGTNIGHFLDLCEACNADPYLTFPHSADQTLVNDWCQKIKTWKTQHPGRRVFIEYSNELWNTQFNQTIMFSGAQALAPLLVPYSMSEVGYANNPSFVEPTDNFNAILAGTGYSAARFFNMVENAAVSGWSEDDYFEVLGWQALGGAGTVNTVLDEYVAERTGGKHPEFIALADYLTWRESFGTNNRNQLVNDQINLLLPSWSPSTAYTTDDDLRATAPSGVSETAGQTYTIRPTANLTSAATMDAAEWANYTVYSNTAPIENLTTAQQATLDTAMVANYPATEINRILREDAGHGIDWNRTNLNSWKVAIDARNVANSVAIKMIRYEYNHHLKISPSHHDPNQNRNLPNWANEYDLAIQQPAMRGMVQQGWDQWREYFAPEDGHIQGCWFISHQQFTTGGNFGVWNNGISFEDTQVSLAAEQSARNRK